MVYDKANELAKLLKESDEFREYKTTKEQFETILRRPL